MLRLRRPLAALLAASVLLFGSTGEALGVHACAHHSHLPGHPAGEAGNAAHDAHGTHGAHDAAAAPAAGHAHPAHAAPAPDAADCASVAETEGGHEDRPAHGGCTCLGGCPVAPVALPMEGAGALRAPPSVAVRAAHPRPDAFRARLLPYLLPYGHAPPVAA